MPNPTSKLNLVINGVTTQLDIHDADAVDLTSNQTVGGIKTFSNAPVVNSISLDGKTIDTDANGDMTYDSHIVDTIEEQGEGYIRYSNGLQICWGNISFTTSSQGWGNLYEGIDTVSQNYPKSFKSAPSVIAGNNGETYCMIESAYGNNVTTPIWCVVRPMAFTNANFTINYIAIGLWK